MFTYLFNCLLSFKNFLNMFYTIFGMDIFHVLWRHLVTKRCTTLQNNAENIYLSKTPYVDVRLLGIYPIIILVFSFK